MPTTTTITKGQREGLYELVRNHLASIEDLWIVLERTRDFNTAERLGLEFGDDFCLLQDIGWQPDEDRDAFELRMPPRDLVALLKRLHGEAVGALCKSGADAQSSREEEEINRRFQVGFETCEILLADLGQRDDD